MANADAPLLQGLAGLVQPYLSWREKQANESKLADMMLPKSLPEYLQGLAYGNLPQESPVSSLRSAATYLPAALELMGAFGIGGKGAKEGYQAAYDAAERAVASGNWIVPPGQLNIFAGPKSRTANIPKWNEAQDIYNNIANGKDLYKNPEWLTGSEHREIYNKTGWFLGPDGKWRYEISDNAASYNPDLISGEFDTSRAESVFPHDELYKAYPDIGYINVNSRVPPGANGVYTPSRNTISINKGLGGFKGKSTGIHELQHAVQAREGFETGGQIGGLGNQNKSDIDPYKAYRNLAGEAEARAVQYRRGYDPDERAIMFPYDSYDVPVSELIVRMMRGQ